MNEQLRIFKSEEFGQVRTVLINEEPWFVGKDIAERLGYKDTSDAIKRHVDEEDKLTRSFADSGQSREMTIINESGMYSLVLKSKLPQAKSFRKWVTSEVLPTLRKTGEYKLHNDNDNEEENNDYLKIEPSKLEQKAIEIFDELNEKTGELGEYFRPKHKTKLALNKFIKDCLMDNATKENCKKAKDTLIMILGNGEYVIYEDIPLEKIKDTNTLAILYDICKNINNSIVGGIQ